MADCFERNVQSVLKIFKIDKLKPYQEEAIKSILNKQDTFVCQPTGSGKSIIYQSALLFLDVVGDCKFSLVVSPLIALMKDQVETLKSIGISATYLKKGDDLDLKVYYI